jgi:hypothetical protein
MKNHLGLIVAVMLGVIAACLNFLYLSNKAANFEKVAFLAVKPQTVIRAGETFRDDHFVALEIPRAGVTGPLLESAVLYESRGTVTGMKATKDYGGGELILRADLKTPPPVLELGENEQAIGVPVDTRTFVPALVRPGDRVSFLVPRSAPAAPAAPAGGENGEEPPSAPLPTVGNSELIGPFKVLSVGNRLASADVFKAAGLPQQQENVLTISVRADGDKLEARAQKLFDLLQAGGLRQAGVVLHPRGKEP